MNSLQEECIFLHLILIIHDDLFKFNIRIMLHIDIAHTDHLVTARKALITFILTKYSILLICSILMRM